MISVLVADYTPGAYSVFYQSWRIFCGVCGVFSVCLCCESVSSLWASKNLSWQTLYISAVTSWRSTLSYIVYEKTPKALSSCVVKATPSHMNTMMMMMMMIWHVIVAVVFSSSLVVGCEYVLWWCYVKGFSQQPVRAEVRAGPVSAPQMCCTWALGCWQSEEECVNVYAACCLCFYMLACVCSQCSARVRSCVLNKINYSVALGYFQHIIGSKNTNPTVGYKWTHAHC